MIPFRGAFALADLRLVVPSAFAWLAAFLATGMTLPSWVAVAAWVLAGGCAALFAVRRQVIIGVAVIALVCVAAALTSTAVGSAQRSPPVLVRAADAPESLDFRGTVTAAPVDGRVAVRVISVTYDDRPVVVSSPVLLFGSVSGAAPIGTSIRFWAKLRRADAGDSVAFLAFARGSATVVAPPAPFLAATDALRSRFRIAAEQTPGDGGVLLPGLAIGDTTAVPERLTADMRTASLTHLTAVSGANCAVVVALAAVILGLFGAPRWLRLGSAATLLVGFVVLVTPQPSVLRAAVMAGVVLLSTALGRPVRGVPVLALAALILTIQDPWLARSYGFVLSALATGGLLMLAGPIGRMLARVLPRRLAMVVAVPIAAQLACQPVLLLLNPALPLYGVLANLLAEPAAGAATVAGLVACVTLPVLPGLGQALTWIAWLPSAWIAAVAKFTAGLPGAAVPWLSGVLGAVSMAVLIAAILAIVFAGRRRQVRLGAVAVVVLSATVWGAVAAGAAVSVARNRPGEWEYGLCDIGQGDATLIRSGGMIALDDTGPDPAKLAACLSALGIHHVDLLVLTHYDLDHVGGTSAVVGMVTRAIIGPSSGPHDDAIAAELRGGGAQVDQVAVGVHGTLGQLDWRVLWPPPDDGETGNPASVVIETHPRPGCTDGCLSGLFLGDLGEDAQDRLVASTTLGRFDVVKVAHHGSADQSPQLYGRIRATVGLIGVGQGNDYGHPTTRLLGILTDVDTAWYRTDVDGMTLVSDAGHGRATVWTQKKPTLAQLSAPGTR